MISRISQFLLGLLILLTSFSFGKIERIYPPEKPRVTETQLRTLYIPTFGIFKSGKLGRYDFISLDSGSGFAFSNIASFGLKQQSPYFSFKTTMSSNLPP